MKIFLVLNSCFIVGCDLFLIYAGKYNGYQFAGTVLILGMTAALWKAL